MKIILGPPGTGKTTRLIRMVEEYLYRGGKPDKVMYLAFTTQAANEAKRRIIDATGLQPADLPWFRTLHSLAFQLGGFRRDDVIRRNQLEEFSTAHGYDISGYSAALTDGMYGRTPDDTILFFEHLARVKCVELEEIAWQFGIAEGISSLALKIFRERLTEFKEDTGYVDFTDIIEFVLEGFRTGSFDSLRPDLLILDEAQDCSQIQWRLFHALEALCEGECVVAGDDDQAIYQWAGADVDHFISLDGRAEVLEQSHRVPKAVWDTANRLVTHIHTRRHKPWLPEPTRVGGVHYVNEIDEIDMAEGTWYLLSRHRFQVKPFEEHVRREGFAYHSLRHSPLESPVVDAILGWEQLRSGVQLEKPALAGVRRYTTADLGPGSSHASLPIWHEGLDLISPEEREYILAVRRRGEKLLGTPRIHINTLHGAKGGEADNVVITTDVTRRVLDGMDNDLDAEIRVFYVGATRAINNLYIVQPQTPLYFDML